MTINTAGVKYQFRKIKSGFVVCITVGLKASGFENAVVASYGLNSNKDFQKKEKTPCKYRKSIVEYNLL